MWMPRALANFLAAEAMIGASLLDSVATSGHPHSLHPDEQGVDRLAAVDDDDLDLGAVALEGRRDAVAEAGLGVGARRRG